MRRSWLPVLLSLHACTADRADTPGTDAWLGDRIEFRRDGTNESLRAADRDAAGMKWLAGKKNCLTIKPGEGYCRD